MLPKFLSITNEKPVFFNLIFKRDNIGPYLSLKHPVADLQTVACRDAHNPQANRFQIWKVLIPCTYAVYIDW